MLSHNHLRLTCVLKASGFNRICRRFGRDSREIRGNLGENRSRSRLTCMCSDDKRITSRSMPSLRQLEVVNMKPNDPEEKRKGALISNAVSSSLRSAMAKLPEHDFNDISQEVAAVVVSRLNKLGDPPRSLERYVRSTAKREVIKAIKAYRSRRKTEQTLLPDILTAPAPEDHSVDEERIGAILEEFQVLSTKERDALLGFINKSDSFRDYRTKDVAIRKLRIQLSKRGLL